MKTEVIDELEMIIYRNKGNCSAYSCRYCKLYEEFCYEYKRKNKYSSLPDYNNIYEYIKNKLEVKQMSTQIEIEINGEKHLIDVDKARELGILKKANEPLVTGGVFYLGSNLEVYKVSSLIDAEKYKAKRLVNGNLFSCKEVADEKQKLVGGLNGRIQTLILEENHKAGLTERSTKNYVVVLHNIENKYVISSLDSRYNYIGLTHTTRDIAEKICERLNRGDR